MSDGPAPALPPAWAQWPMGSHGCVALVVFHIPHLQQMPPVFAAGFGAGSHGLAGHRLLGMINVVFVILRQWVTWFLPNIWIRSWG